MITRTIIVFGALLGVSLLAIQCIGESAPPAQTFAIETYVGRTYNYLDNLVDKDGLPYFNIFWDRSSRGCP